MIAERPMLRTVRLAVFVLATLVVGLRADGLPGEYLLSHRWREVLAPVSPLTNPAFIVEANFPTIRIAATSVMQGSFGLGEVGVTVPFGWHQSAGVTLLGEAGGEVEGGVLDGTWSNEETSSNNNAFVMLTYALKPWRQLSIGLNVNLAVQSNFGDSRYGLGMDLGLSYLVARHPAFGQHTVGLTIQNLLAPAVGDPSAVIAFGDNGAYSGDLRVSWLGEFIEGRVFGGLDLNIKDIFAAAEEFQNAAGESTDKTVEWNLALRAGGWILRVFEAHGMFGFDQHGIDYWALAGGINVPSVNAGRDLAVLYQFSRNPESDVATMHTLYCRAEVGLHREELYAKRMARKMNLEPSRLYNLAMTLFHQGKYFDAFFIYSQILSEYPEFFRNDWVSYYRGRCQEELDMRNSAMETYRQVKIRYGQANVAAHADLGMMRIYYRENDEAQVANKYQDLGRVGVPDSLRKHGLYMVGHVLHGQGRNAGALEAFTSIPEGHPEYLFARHSAAVVAFAMDDMDKAIEYLKAVINATPTTDVQRELVNRSYLLLGYALYEREELADAVAALRLVKKTSTYYEDAQLGLAWCALRARQWADCRQACQELIQVGSTPVLQEEGRLVMAYAHLTQKQNKEALTILRTASARLDSITKATNREPERRATQAGEDRKNYDALAFDVNRIAMDPDADLMPMEQDSLHRIQSDYEKRLRDYYTYQDALVRTRFFARNLDKVKEDVEYALAVVQRMVSTKDVIELQREMQDTQQDIEDEIEKLEGELEQLEE